MIEDIIARNERIIERLNARAEYLEARLAELERHAAATRAAIELWQAAETQPANVHAYIKLLN